MIDKLEFLLALARERHFGRAAEACGVTQPTLSAGVKQLEEQMGVLLVNRGSRFQGFTPEGERCSTGRAASSATPAPCAQEINALRHGLTGRLRIAAIPTALAMVASLTTPFRQRHPNVQFTIMSRTSIEVLEQLENLEIDAGVTYLDNEPLGRVTAVPLYRERYRLLTSSDAPLGDRDSVTWAEVAQVPLCLLTPNMQNRRIIDGLLRGAGGNPQPTLESNSMIVLFAHVRTGRWASVMPSKLAETLGLTETIRAIPIVEPEAVHTIGLVVPAREPMTPLNAALVSEAKRLARTLDPTLKRREKAMLLVPTRLAPSNIHGFRRVCARPNREGHASVAFRKGSRHGVRAGRSWSATPSTCGSFSPTTAISTATCSRSSCASTMHASSIIRTRPMSRPITRRTHMASTSR